MPGSALTARRSTTASSAPSARPRPLRSSSDGCPPRKDGRVHVPLRSRAGKRSKHTGRSCTPLKNARPPRGVWSKAEPSASRFSLQQGGCGNEAALRALTPLPERRDSGPKRSSRSPLGSRHSPSSTRSISSRPSCRAISTSERPRASRAPTSAPCRSSVRAASTLFFKTAHMSGVHSASGHH